MHMAEKNIYSSLSGYMSNCGKLLFFNTMFIQKKHYCLSHITISTPVVIVVLVSLVGF
jgi:hypothetical protein